MSDLPESVEKFRDRQRIEINTGVAYDFRKAGRPGGQHRLAEAHGLEGGDSESFIERGINQELAVAQQSVLDELGDEAGEDDSLSLARSEAGHELVDEPTLASHDHEFEIGASKLARRQRPRDQLKIFAGLQGADHRRIRPQTQGRCVLLHRVKILMPLDVLVDDARLRRYGGKCCRKSCTRCLRNTEHGVIRLQLFMQRTEVMYHVSVLVSLWH